jgi:hypothetical protein
MATVNMPASKSESKSVSFFMSLRVYWFEGSVLTTQSLIYDYLGERKAVSSETDSLSSASSTMPGVSSSGRIIGSSSEGL